MNSKWVGVSLLFLGMALFGSATPISKMVGEGFPVFTASVVIFSVYFLYIGTYDFPAFVEHGFNETKTFGAIVGTTRDWLRPIAALAAGFLADRYIPSSIISGSLIILFLVFGSFCLIDPGRINLIVFAIQMACAALAVFAARGIYFALLEEIKTPFESTGITVGIVSFIGFLPDTFAYWLSGWLVDHYGSILGHQIHFGLLSLMALVGFWASMTILFRMNKRDRNF